MDRGYVEVNQRRLHPTPVGEIVNDLLVDNFGEYVDLDRMSILAAEWRAGAGAKAGD